MLSKERVLLLAGGVGVTPLRALLEDLPHGIHPVVILRASRDEEVLFRRELPSTWSRSEVAGSSC